MLFTALRLSDSGAGETEGQCVTGRNCRRSDGTETTAAKTRGDPLYSHSHIQRLRYGTPQCQGQWGQMTSRMVAWQKGLGVGGQAGTLFPLTSFSPYSTSYGFAVANQRSVHKLQPHLQLLYGRCPISSRANEKNTNDRLLMVRRPVRFL